MYTVGTKSKLVRNIVTISIGVTRVNTSTSPFRALSKYINAIEKQHNVYPNNCVCVIALVLTILYIGEH